MDATDAAVESTNRPPKTMHIIIKNQPGDIASNRFIIPPVPSIQKEQCQSKSLQIDSNKSFQATTGLQTYHERIANAYQVAHCKVIPAPLATAPKELPALESKPRSFRKTRVTQVADSFAQSLRKYPRALPEFARSSEVIERLLSATLAKRLSKSKKSNSKRRNKKTKCHHEVPYHKKQLYPQRKRVTCNCSKYASQVAPHGQPTTSAMSSIKKHKDLALRDISPRVHRMGRGAEVRYLNDVRKCIRDAIRHVWDDDAMVCPEIERRFAQHQREYHRPNNDMACDTFCFDAKNHPNKGLIKHQPEPEEKRSLQNEEESKICYQCKKTVPCECLQRLLKDTPSPNVLERERDVKYCNRSTSLDYFMNTVSCCHLCKEDHDDQLFKQVNEWHQEIPLNADCSEEDKAKRQKIIRTLVKSLVKYKGVENKQKEEIKKALDKMPMWQPVDSYDRDLFINSLIENLMIRLTLVTDTDDDLKRIVNEWFEKFLFKQNALDKKAINKDNVLNKFLFKILSLKLNEPSGNNNHNEIVRSHVIDLFKKNIVQSIDVNIINRAADELIRVLNKEFNKKSNLSEHKQKAIQDTNVPETSKVLVDVNIDKDLEAYVHKTTGQNNVKDDIKKIIEITKRNNLDPRTESLLMEALIMKVKALSASITSNSESVRKQQNNMTKRQNVQEMIDTKMKQVVEQLPLAIAHNMKNVLKDEIVDIISNKVNTESSLKLPKTFKEDIRNYVKELIAGVLKAYAGDMRNQKKFQNDLTNLIADQVVRCDNTSKFKEKAYTLLREANLSESEMEEVYNSLLRHTIDMSFSLKNKMSPLLREETSKKRTGQSDSKRTEKEVISFISYICCDLNSNVKEKLLLSAKHLAVKIEKVTSEVKYSIREKEEIIVKLVFSYFKNHNLPLDESSRKRIIKWIKRLLNIPQESSTPKHSGTESYMISPTLSTILKDDENLKILSHGSLVQIYESPSLNIMSQEVVKCIERIPSERMISHDKNYHKIVAKEIAQRLREAANQSSNPEMALKQTVLRWLPKLVKKPNETELTWMTSILKKVMEEKEITDVSTASGYHRQNFGLAPGPLGYEYPDQCIEALRKGIMNWLQEKSLYQKRNVHEKRFQENLVSDLAIDLNRIISDSANNYNDDLIIKILETRIKHFPMDTKEKCDKKYHRSLAIDILKYLKDANIIPKNKNSSLDVLTDHVLKWIEKIPPDRIISQDEKHQKAIAKEIAKRVLEAKNERHNPDLALECEVLRWLPKIVKEPTDTELHWLKGNLKKIVFQETSINVLAIDDANEFINTLKDVLMRWLKSSTVYYRRNTQEELCQENVMTNLAVDLEYITNNLPPNPNVNFEKFILQTIESRLKHLPLNSRIKNSDNYNFTMAIDLLNYLKDLNILQIVRKTHNDSKNNIALWIENLPLKWNINSQDCKEVANRIYSMLPDYLDNSLGSRHTNKRLKSVVGHVLKELPLREEFQSEDKLEMLVDNLLVILKYNSKNNYMNTPYFVNNSKDVLETELTNKCAYLPIEATEGPAYTSKIREELVSGLVNIINKQNLDYIPTNEDTFYETHLNNEVERLLDTLHVNERCKRNLYTFKNYLVDVVKDVCKTKQKDKAVTNYKQHVYDIIEKTLPTTSNLSSDQQTSFNDLKEKLVEAFITLFKTPDMNTGKFKEILQKEVNKFCSDYLKRYPATPLDTDKLRDNLFSALQNMPVPDNETLSHLIDTNNKIKDYLEELPLKVTEENILLRDQFVNFIQKYLEDEREAHNFNLRVKLMEKLKRFTFLSDYKPNITEMTENIVKIVQHNNQMTQAHTQLQNLQEVEGTLQQNNVQTKDNLDKQTKCTVNREAKETFTYDLPLDDRQNVGNKDVQINLLPNNSGNQINPRPEYTISEKNKTSESVSCSEFKNSVPKEAIKRLHVPADADNRPDLTTSPQYNKTKVAQTANQCDLSPRIIVKEYYWDSNATNELVNSHPELQTIHNELRRTVPSLPFTKIDLPAPHCRSSRRQCLESPCRSHMSTAEPNLATVSIPINQSTVEENIWTTRKSPATTRYRQSNISLGRNVDRPEIISKPLSEPKTRRKKFCSDQTATYSNGGIDEDRRRTKDYCFSPELTDCGSVMRPQMNNMTTDIGYSLSQDRDEKKRCSCYGHVHQKIVGAQTSDSSRVTHQCTSNINNCVKCRGGICLHPSYIYFN